MVIPKGFLIRKTEFALFLSFLFLFSFHILPSTKTKQPEISLQLKEIKEGNYLLLNANKKVILLWYHLKSLDQKIAGDEYTMKIPASQEITNCPEIIIKPVKGWKICGVKLEKDLNIQDEIVLKKRNLVVNIRCRLAGYKIEKGILYLLLRSNCFGIKAAYFNGSYLLSEEKYDLLIDWNRNNEIVLGNGTLCFENQGVQGGTN